MEPVSTLLAAEAAEPGSVVDQRQMEMEVVPRGDELRPLAMDEGYYEPGACDAYGGGCGDACGACFADCGDCGGGFACGPRCGGLGCCGLLGRALRNMSFFAGAHGFKGPADLGRNGNFGLHAGVNWGAPLGGPYGVGYQVGVQSVHSNFSGDQAAGVVRSGDRDQIFFTAGIFRRAVCRRLQWGVVYDLLHDSYHSTADFSQVRTEIALVTEGRREIGFWGAFGTGSDEFLFANAQPVAMQPTDLYAFFYRRHFCEGGQGRLWVGVSGEGDGLLGADCSVPLGRSWALESNVTYLVPEQGRGPGGGQSEESWGLGIQLVWYPGRDARCARSSPFHPLLNVADNSVFLLDQQ